MTCTFGTIFKEEIIEIMAKSNLSYGVEYLLCNKVKISFITFS